jgi:hypothetical protein
MPTLAAGGMRENCAAFGRLINTGFAVGDAGWRAEEPAVDFANGIVVYSQLLSESISRIAAKRSSKFSASAS